MRKIKSIMISSLFMSSLAQGAEWEEEIDLSNLTSEQLAQQRALLEACAPPVQQQNPMNIIDVDNFTFAEISAQLDALEAYSPSSSAEKGAYGYEEFTLEEIAQIFPGPLGINEVPEEAEEYADLYNLTPEEIEQQRLRLAELTPPTYGAGETYPQRLNEESHESKEMGSILKAYKAVSDHLRTIPSNSNVHILDPYVLSTEQHMKTLFSLGDLIGMGRGDMSWAQIKTGILALFPATFITEYREDKPKPHLPMLHIITYNDAETVTTHSLCQLLNRYLNNIQNEFRTLAATFPANSQLAELSRQLFSRVLTSVQQFEARGEEEPIRLLAQSLAENKITGGGCLQGRVVRMFVFYNRLLGEAGGQQLIDNLV